MSRINFGKSINKVAKFWRKNHKISKLPEYIYHITTKKNYEKMCQSGYIKQSQDTYCGWGVFATDIKNLCTQWGKTKLLKNLLNFVDKDGDGNLVMLRIPVKKLMAGKLQARTLVPMISNISGLNFKFIVKARKCMKDGVVSVVDLRNMTKKNLWKKIGMICKGKHLAGAFNSKKPYPYEIIYRGDIPISYAEKVGEGNLGLSDGDKSIRNWFLNFLNFDKEKKFVAGIKKVWRL